MENSKYEAKTHTSYNKSLIESRFKVFLFLFRMGGIPLNMKSVSRLNALYNVSVIVCFILQMFLSVWICLYIDISCHSP